MLEKVVRKLIWFGLLLLTACQLNASEQSSSRKGRLLIWHMLVDKQAEVLTSTVEQYTKLYPGISITLEHISNKEIANRFLSDVQLGLGPDLLLIRYTDLPLFIQAEMVEDLTEHQVNTAIYQAATVSQVTYQGRLFAVPYAIETEALCYNKARIKDPPQTLNNLLWAAKIGHRVAFRSTFVEAFWGQALFESSYPNSQNVVKLLLDKDAITQWLTWLQRAQDEPNIVLNEEREVLHQAFAEEEFDIYTCSSFEIPALQDSLGKKKLGVVPLPSRGDRSAGPFLHPLVFLMSKASSPQNIKLSLHLTEFLTNVRQQIRMTLETEALIPSNREVKLDNRLTPVVAALLTQAKTGVATSLDHYAKSGALGENTQDEDSVKNFGQRMMTQVIEGQLAPRKAAEELVDHINNIFSNEQQDIQ